MAHRKQSADARAAAHVRAPQPLQADRTLADIERQAKEGDIGAMYEVALCYYLPRCGARCELQEAVKWLKEASEGGVLKAHALLATCYFEGTGIGVDKVEAVRKARLAEGSDEPTAQLVLGRAYSEGSGGVDKDEEASGKLYASAKKGLKRRVEASTDPLDQLLLAMCYLEGWGTRQGDAKAAEWFKKAADQGVARAQELLGKLLQGWQGACLRTSCRQQGGLQRSPSRGMQACSANWASATIMERACPRTSHRPRRGFGRLPSRAMQAHKFGWETPMKSVTWVCQKTPCRQRPGTARRPTRV